MIVVKTLIWKIIRNIIRTKLLFSGSFIKGEFCRRTTIENNVKTHKTSNLLRSKLSNNTRIGKNCIVADSIIGSYTIIQQGTITNLSTIGKFCSIADYSRIGAERHPIERVSSHMMTYWPSIGFVDKVDTAIYDLRKNNPTIIGNDVHIGHGSIIMPGVTIGDGTVIGAGAVVTKDIEKYCIAVGCPAKKIKMRFDADIIQDLIEIGWWDWPTDIIRQRIIDFNDVKNFCKKYR
ncbi:DapH/DapD/GlmU-related protein [Thermodesulfobacteriota bacterium]